MPGRPRTCGALGRPERPDDHVLPGREMEDRLALEHDLVRRHRVQVDLGLRGLQRPWAVVDLGSVQPPAILRVEAVALGKEVLERSELRRRRLADSAVRAAEGLALVARALVDDPAAAPLE